MDIQFDLDSEEFQKNMDEKMKDISSKLPKVVKLCCERVRATALSDMAKTSRNTMVSYRTGNVTHHPSLPGNAPAPDTGNLRASIHYTVDEKKQSVVGRVGTDVEYGKMLEYGTSHIAPRPWLKPALDKNSDYIKSIFNHLLGGK